MKGSLRLLSFCFLGLYACATTGARIIERADNLSSSPDWAMQSKTSWDENGKRYFVGWIEVPGDRSKSAALIGSDRKAMDMPWQSLTQEFFEQVQMAEELEKDATLVERVTSEVRGKRPQAAVTITKHYWEVVEVKKAEATEYDLRAYSLAEITTQEFERAKKKYFDELRKSSEVKKVLNQVGEVQRNKVLNRESSEE